LLGILVSVAGMKLLLAMLPPTGGYGEVPHKEWIGINGPVLGFTLLLSLFTGMLFGLVPAIQISRTDLSESLKEGGKGSTARHDRLARSLIIVSELALSLVLLVGAGLLLQSFARLLAEDPGFNPNRVLTAQIWLPPLRYTESRKVSAFLAQTLENVSALPGVQSATAINFLPLSGWQDQIDFAIEGRPAPPPGQEFTSQYRVVAPNYFQTMGIPLRAGRMLASSDGADAPAAVVINQALVQRYWPGQNSVGQRIQIDFGDSKSPWRPAARKDWATIVGVVGDVREWQWGEQKIGELYVSSLQNPSHLMSLAVRTGSDPVALAPALRQAVFAVDREQPLTSIKTMDQLLAEAVAQRRLNAALLACFAALALVMAAVGIYGVMAYSVAQRTHEIGIRLAVGAQPRDVLRLIVIHGMRLAFIGVGIGIAASLWTARLLSSFLYGVHTSDPLTFAAVALLLITVAFAACYIPARRAMRVNPIDALRYE
jgi:putative ABC transport system permease protein